MQYFVRIIEFLKHHLTKGDETAASWVNVGQESEKKMGFKDIPAYNNKSGFPLGYFASLCFYMYFCRTKAHINDYQRQNNEP